MPDGEIENGNLTRYRVKQLEDGQKEIRDCVKENSTAIGELAKAQASFKTELRIIGGSILTLLLMLMGMLINHLANTAAHAIP